MREVRLAVAVMMMVGGVAMAAPPPTMIELDIPEPPMVRPLRLPPSPAPDVIAHAKSFAGAWECGGKNMSAQLELDGAWLRFVTPGRVTFRSYDPVAKLWTQLVMTSAGETYATTSTGEERGEWVFGNAGVRDHERVASGKLARWGEVNVNGRWVKTYEVTCARV